MAKLLIPPVAEGYTLSDGERNTVSTMLDGPGSNVRLALGSTSLADCTWKCGSEAYRYLRAFYHVYKSMPFLCDLIKDTGDVATFYVSFLPDTFKLTGKIGDTYIVQASLEVGDGFYSV